MDLEERQALREVTRRYLEDVVDHTSTATVLGATFDRAQPIGAGLANTGSTVCGRRSGYRRAKSNQQLLDSSGGQRGHLAATVFALYSEQEQAS